jgi:hypothetical protein
MKKIVFTICALFSLVSLSVADDKFVVTKLYKPNADTLRQPDPITNSFVIDTIHSPSESPKDGCLCSGEEGFTKLCNSKCDCRGGKCDCENCTCFKESDVVKPVQPVQPVYPQTYQPARQPQQNYYKQPTVYFKIPAATTYSGGCASGGCSTPSRPLRRLFGR